MNVAKLALAAVLAAALAGCGKKPAEPPKAAPEAATAAAPAAAPQEGAKKEEAHEAPDTHGMPGMSKLFESKDEKK